MSALPNSPIALSLENAIDPNPLTVTPETLVLEAIALMHRENDLCNLSQLPLTAPASTAVDLPVGIQESNVSCLLVVDQKKLVGLLTERDLVRLAAQGINLTGVKVTEVMNRQLIAIAKSELHDIFGVLSLFREYRIRHLPILSHMGELLGILSLEGMRDALQAAYLLKLRRVAEMMTTEVIHAKPTASIREVAQLMNEHQISSVVICESEPHSNQQIPVGIITERDMVQFHTLQLNLDQISAEKVMSTPVWSVGPEDSLWVVHETMHQRRIRHLVVCQPGDTAASRFWRRRSKSLCQPLPLSAARLGSLLGIVTQTSLMQVIDPSEMFSMINLLQREVSQIEQEKIQLLNSGKTFLEQQVQERTVQLQEQADYQRLLGTVAQRIRQSLNLEEILTTTVKEVRQLLGCDRVLIYRCNGSGKDGLVAESVDGLLHPPLASIVCDSCLVLTGKSGTSHSGIRAIADIYTAGLHPLEISGWEELGFRAGLLMPIIQTTTQERSSLEATGKNPPGVSHWGFLIAGQYHNPRVWQASQIQLLEQLATQLAIAIQQSTLLQQVKAELAERQQAENALAQQHHFVSTILDVIGALVVVLDCQGQILKFNQACEQTTGYRFDEAIGQSVWDLLLLPEEVEAVRNSFNALKAGQFPNQYQNYWLRKDGNRRLISWSNTCLTDHQGKVEYVIATGIDITERNQAEIGLKTLNEELEIRVEQRTAALQTLNQELEKEIRDRQQAESERQRLLAAVEIASDGIGILTQEKYRYLNRAHVELFGYDNAQELLGKNWQELYQPDEQQRLHRNIFPILKTENHWCGETIAQRKDGSTFVEELSLTLTENGDLICVCRNIEERKKMEKALRSSEAKFRATFEQAAVGIALCSSAGKFLKTNQKFRQIVGYRENELLQKTIFDLTDADHLRQTRKFLQAVLQGNLDTYSLDKRYHCKNGTLVWVNVTVSLVAESSGQPDYFLAVIKDISDRKQSEAELQKVLQELAYHKQALDQFAIVTITDPQGVITYVNDKFCEISGYSRDEAIGQTHKIVNSGYHPPSFFKQLWLTISRGKIWQDQVKNQTKNSKNYWVDTTIVPFLNDEGKPFQYLAIRIDITERKLTEEKIKQRESQLTAQYKGIPVPTYTWQQLDDDFVLIDYNHASEIITQKNVISLLGIKLSLMYQNNSEILEDFWECFRTQQTLQREYWYEMRSPNQKKYLIANYVFVPPDLVMIHTQDLTEHKQAEALLKASLAEKEVLLKEIHHRVKNNLQVISSLLNLQSQYIEQPELLSQFEDSQNRIQSMALIHEKLYRSHDLAHIDFSDYIESLVDHLFLSYGLGMTQIKPILKIAPITLNLDTAIPCGLIINELVSNALKHGFPQGGEGTISVEIEPVSDSDHFMIVISDNGIGFPADLDFSQVESSLGLQLVCTLTQQLRGKIELDRSQGTRFKLILCQIKKTKQ